MARSCIESAGVVSGEIDLAGGAVDLCRALRERQTYSLFLDGAGRFRRPWTVGGLVAVEPRRHPAPTGGGASAPLAALDALVRARRAAGGAAETGVAALLPYEALARPPAYVFEVDRAVRFDRGGGEARLVVRTGPEEDPSAARRDWERLAADLASARPREAGRAARIRGGVRTSLRRELYLRSVERIRDHIAAGDLYQANLCQRFVAEYAGDELQLYQELSRRSPAPLSAFVDAGEVVLASVSPEVFVRADRFGRISTFPIKGTRPRGATPDADEAAKDELLSSEKDRAELLMIVDLERNDLGRICRVGSIRVRELAALESFPAVHHLVAHVEGRLAAESGAGDLLRAVFPGGSITGAPKIRAMQILEEIESAPRGLFTGCLFWFGDDGTTDSSILIRSIEFRDGEIGLGAGGGIVADSDPEQEWRESNHKARALAEALGFSPEEAG